MALTEAQERELLDSHKSIQDTLKEILPALKSLPEVQKAVSELAKGNTDLSSKLSAVTQEQTFQTLKSKYPDVPESTLRAFPDAVRETEAKIIQDQISKVKVRLATETDPKDPMSLWARAGGIGPTDEAAIAAEREEQKQIRDKAKNSGDVFGMLKSRTKETLAHLGQTFGRA